MTLKSQILSRSVQGLTRLSCVLALLGLSALCLSVLWPRPLPIIFAMTGGHVIGAAAFCCYLLAVVLDLARLQSNPPATSSSGTQAGSPPSEPS
jgi:hypothetical protein